MKINMKGKKAAEVLIYEDIGDGWLGGISAKNFAKEIKSLGDLDTINVRINSYGGSVFDGIAIYNTLKKNSAKISIDIDGIAASIASIIAMSADPGELRIAENGYMMIHDPWGFAMGNADDMRAQAELLDNIRDTLLDTYMLRASAEREKVSDMMADETWLNAKDALSFGFVDQTTEEVKIAACANKNLMNKFRNIPENLKQPTLEKVNNAKVLQSKMQNVLRKYKI